jgi:hypothetical protein
MMQTSVRLVGLLLLCGAARADVALPSAKPRAGWAQVCVARFEKARIVAAKIEPKLANGKIGVTVDEELWPLVEHVRFSGHGVIVIVEPARNKKMRMSGWDRVEHVVEMAQHHTRRITNGRVAEVRVVNEEKFVVPRLVSVWQDAADDCLEAR